MSMKSSSPAPQEQQFFLELKDALNVPHRGPGAIPRKEVWSPLGRSEAWYSLILDHNKNDLPSLLDFRRLGVLTGNAEPLRVFAKWWGTGHEIAETDPKRILSNTLKADGSFVNLLSELLEDGVLSQQDACDLIPRAEARLRQAQEALDLLRERAGRNR